MKKRTSKLLSLLLTLTMVLGMLPFMSTTAMAATVLIGDVDGNGTVNKADSILLDRYVANWTGYADKVNMDAADVNRDGNVNKADAILLARYIANWTVESQIGQTVEVGEPEELKIVQQPLDVEMTENSAVLSITVSGTFDSITYDWQKETASGWRKVATLNSEDATYTVNNAALQIISRNGTEGFGRYRCIVSAFNGGKLVDQVTSRVAEVDPQAAPMKAGLSLGESAGKTYYYFYHTGHRTGEIDPELGYLYEETNARIFKTYDSQERFEEATQWIVGEPDWMGTPGESPIAGFWIREGRMKGGPYAVEAFQDANGAYLKNENGEYVTTEVLLTANYFECSIESVSGGKGPYNYTWYLSQDRFGNDFQPLIEGKNCMGQGTENIRVWPFEPGKGMNEPHFMGFLCCRIIDSKGRQVNATYYRYKYGNYSEPGYMYNYQMLYAFYENSEWIRNADACIEGKPGHVHKYNDGAGSEIGCSWYTYRDNQGIGRWW